MNCCRGEVLADCKRRTSQPALHSSSRRDAPADNEAADLVTEMTDQTSLPPVSAVSKGSILVFVFLDARWFQNARKNSNA